MKKLGHAQPAERLLFSRHSGAISAPRRAIFAAFGLDEYEDASVLRISEYSGRLPAPSSPDELPDNIIRFTTLQGSRRKA